MNSLTASTAGPALSASATARTSRVPTITPSAIRPTAAACSGVPIPNPTAAGTAASARTAPTSSARPSGSSSRSPVTRVSETT